MILQGDILMAPAKKSKDEEEDKEEDEEEEKFTCRICKRTVDPDEGDDLIYVCDKCATGYDLDKLWDDYYDGKISDAELKTVDLSKYALKDVLMTMEAGSGERKSHQMKDQNPEDRIRSALKKILADVCSTSNQLDQISQLLSRAEKRSGISNAILDELRYWKIKFGIRWTLEEIDGDVAVRLARAKVLLQDAKNLPNARELVGEITVVIHGLQVEPENDLKKKWQEKRKNVRFPFPGPEGPPTPDLEQCPKCGQPALCVKTVQRKEGFKTIRSCKNCDYREVE